MKELKWKHRNSRCDCLETNQTKPTGMEVLTPYPKKRNGFERFLDRYNHIMEFVRTMLAITTIMLQLIILYRLTS